MSIPPFHHLSLLPIEVQSSLFKQAIRKSFKTGLHIPSLLPHLTTILNTTKTKTLLLPQQVLEEGGEAHYIPLVKSMQTLKIWIEYLVTVYKEVHQISEITPSDQQQLDPLYQQLKEIADLLEKTRGPLLERRKKNTADFAANLKDAILVMQQKTEEIARKVAVVYRLVGPSNYECAKQLIAFFFENFITLSEQIKTLIIAHREEWSALTLREGRDLFVKNLPNAPCSFLISVEGSCYPLIESVEHLLGKGSDKIVFRAVALPSGKIKAVIKPVSPEETEEADTKKEHRNNSQLFNMWTETELLIKLKAQPGVIQIDERMVFDIEEKKQLFLVEDYYWDGSLHDYFFYTIKNKRSKARLTEKKISSIMQQTLEGLASIHKAGILHHDIKPDNILFDDSEEEPRAVIADFQLAAHENDLIRLDYLRCRAAWVSPEYAQLKLSDDPKKHFASVGTKALDIWSLGIVFYILTTHTFPQWIKSSRNKEDLKEEGSIQKKEEAPDKESKTEKEELAIFAAVAALTEGWLQEDAEQSPYFPLLKKMLAVDPSERCTAQEALEILNTIDASKEMKA